MARAIAHRGPDGEGIYISPDGKVGLGHRRLAIIDLSPTGAQPMSYKDRYWITFNGEIYNFREEKRKLEKKGYQFTSQSDTEVILALYDAYQEKCLDHLRGMFAFALYDAQAQILFCARDRVGQKPFKYFFSGACFLFASELKAILTQSEYHPQLDELAIHHYLTYQYVPAPLTGFVQIDKLEAGHYLIVDVRKATVTKKCYWQMDFSKKADYTPTQWQEMIITTLGRACREQMMADVPLGAFLSGGVDSSAVVGLMRQHASGKIKTFSIGFPDRRYNELAYARQVANHFKTDHTELMVKPEALEVLPELVAQFEEPYADSSAVPTYYLSKLARGQVTVALNGDGGDENFAGYPWHNFHKLALLLDRLPLQAAPGLRPLVRLAYRLSPTTFLLRATRFAESLADQALRRYVSYFCYFTNQQKKELYQPIFEQRWSSLDSYDLPRQRAGGMDAALFDQALLFDITSYLPDDLLVKIDLASMLVSLEARSPFLDHELMELTAMIPASLKIKGLRQNKYILKQALRNLLPVNILTRPKMGFRVPIEKWFRGNMREYVQTVLFDPRARLTQAMLRPEAIAALWRQHTATPTNLAPQLWALLTLELWLRRYFP